MSFTIIDLNDTNIRVSTGDQMLVNSPGYAVIKDNKIVFGLQAVKLARIYPRSTHDDFWYHLGQEAIQSTSSQIRHNADLAYMHLAEIYEQAGKPTSWLIAVPSSFNQEQLGLLLGLLKAANFHEVKLIDSALLASIVLLNQGEYLHLDIQLHQSVLTRIEANSNHRVIATEVLPEPGMLAIYDKCAELIGKEFINQSRFDPHHNAESEQLLYENIPPCLSKLSNSSMAKVDIEYQANSYSANIKREAILEQLSTLYEAIYKHIDDPAQLIFSHRFEGLPGFFDTLTNAMILDEHAVFTSAKQYTAFLRDTDSNTNYLSELPALVTSETPTAPITSIAQPSVITHILIDNIAYQLDAKNIFFTAEHQLESSLSDNSHFSIHVTDGCYSLQPENNARVSLNDTVITGKTMLCMGDRIKTAAANKNSTLIKVT